METLAIDWVDQAQRLGATTLSARALDASARRFLKALARDIRDAQSDAQQIAKGRGERPLNASNVTREARRHADDHPAQGFSLNDVITEYRALRTSVARRWLSIDPNEDPRRLTELVRLDEAVDQTLSEAVERYAAGLELNLHRLAATHAAARRPALTIPTVAAENRRRVGVYLPD
ncbi:RsbRD N-terminal domain-containing protein [Burkholderia sp. Bp9031]|uniref:RsbRD N-terminal domain-containing protein n=1 Tax=Burkholderia sp. Bp9031 TaxID=2184566 RepID=UPI00163B0F47